MSKIKFDLEIKFGSQYGKEEEEAVLKVLRNNAPTSGDECIQFEKNYAEYTGAKYARVVSNGTNAIFLSLIGIDLKPGDHVLTTPVTWIATATATLGAEVDFVDIDPVTYNLDPNQLEDKLTSNTKAVLPVHLYGQSCDMDEIIALSEKHHFSVIEDAAHAIGAEYKGKKVGSIGITGCFSFHEQKNISTLGEGGIVITNDAKIFEQISLYRSHCTRVHRNSTKYCKLDEEKLPVGKKIWWQDFDDCSYNFRMTDIQAAVGIEQLKKVDMLNQRRIDNAAYITSGLDDVPGLTLPTVLPHNKHVFHLSEFGMTKEDFIDDMLNKFGIKIGFHYIPLHNSTAFKNREFKKRQFPSAEKPGEQMVILPINLRQTEEAQEYLAKSIKAARAAAFMGYKMICDRENIEVTLDNSSDIDRYTDMKWNGYLANLSKSVFHEKYESMLPEKTDAKTFLQEYSFHVDPFTPLKENVVYNVRANTRYAVEENYRVQLFSELSRGASLESSERSFILMGELMYQSHYAYTECGLGSKATDFLVNLCRKEGVKNGIYGAKITGGGAGGTVAILAKKSASEVIRKIFNQYAQSGMGDPYLFEGSSDGADAFGIVEIN